MEQLFLLEVVVDTISFQSVAMVPQKKQIIIVATFGNLVTLEIRTDTLGALEHTSENKRKDIDINFGKSYFFFAKSADLLNALARCPLEMMISTKTNPAPIANATINWESDFTYMLSSCNDNVGYMTPAFQAGMYEMRHKDLIVGDIELFVRLSCFGKSISTNMQIVKPPKDAKDGMAVGTKFLFKSANAATTYECQIYGMGTSQEFIPIAPMYQSVDVPTQIVGMRPYERQRSTDTISAESRVPSVFVMDMPVRDFNPVDLKNLADLLTGHRESMIVRPDEMQFTNLQQLMEVQMETESVSDESDEKSSLDLTELTVEKIEKQLCKCKDCPAARMFKDYGIGPLATGKGLGTVFNRNEVKLPTTYGISQTFGHDDRYGPFGLYSRPKRPDQPFVPRNSYSSMKKSRSESTGKCEICNKLKGGAPDDERSVLIRRLRGGGIGQVPQSEILKCFREQPLQYRVPVEADDFIVEDLDSSNIDDEKAMFCTYMSKMIRLRAGGRNEDDVEDNSPMYKCRDLMQQFDRVVSAYKKALGPCGKAICPFAQNVINERCRQACPGTSKATTPADNITSDSVTSCPGPEDDMSACGNETCEYRRRPESGSVTEEFQKGQLKSACGDPTCAYVRQRLGSADDVYDDGGIKLHDLPRNCGGPSCPYTAMDPLPPIHWDCPDPLPKGGICRNLDCPIMRQKHIIDCSFTAPRPPCGQGTCPYAPPPPCDFKGCPFGPLIEPCPSFCPYKRDPYPRKCPYTIEEPKDPCVDPSCPYNLAASNAPTPDAAGECFHGPGGHSPDEPCPNPNCPYNTGGGFDGDDAADGNDSLAPCDMTTCKAVSGGPYECSECTARDVCDCHMGGGGRGQGDTKYIEREQKQMQQEQQVYTSQGAPIRRSKDVEPPMEKKEVAQGQNLDYKNPSSSSPRSSGAAINSTSNNPPAPSQQPPQPTTNNAPPQAPQQNAPTSTAAIPLSSAAPSTTNGRHKRKRKGHRTKFVYDEGDTYPGLHVGHKFCNVPAMNVPKNMGWLWNIKPQCGRLKPRRGWRPGAITRTIAARIEEHRRQLGILPLASQKPSKRRLKKKKDGTYGGYESESDEELTPKPTLVIKKKEGCYWITMNPLKDPATLEENENPYIECTPMQFRIAKNGGDEKKEDVMSCHCGADEATAIGANPEDSDSELDIEFTPPAGIIHPERQRRKRNIVHIDTQYDMNDFLPPQLQLDITKKSAEEGNGGKKDKGAKKGGKKGGKGGGKKKKK